MEEVEAAERRVVEVVEVAERRVVVGRYSSLTVLCVDVSSLGLQGKGKGELEVLVTVMVYSS